MWLPLIVAIVLVILGFLAWKKLQAAGPIPSPKEVAPAPKPAPAATPVKKAKSPTREVVPEAVEETPRSVFLTDADWEVLLESSEEEKLSAGDALLKEGEANTDVFRLLSGTVNISRKFKGNQVCLTERLRSTTLREVSEPGTTFGEKSILARQKTTASVTAATDCTVKRVSADVLRSKFSEDADLAIRFYRSLGRQLKIQLNDVNHKTRDMEQEALAVEIGEVEPKAKSKGKRSRFKKHVIADDDMDGHNEKAHKRFPNLPATSIVTRKVACSLMKGKGSRKNGTLYVTNGYLAFYTKIFGMSHKDLIPLEQVYDLDTIIVKPKYMATFKVPGVVVDKPGEESVTLRLTLLREDDFDHIFGLLQEGAALQNDAPTSDSSLSNTGTMTEKDWTLVLTENSENLLQEFEAGTAIITKGSYATNIMQVASGVCDVVVDTAIVANLQSPDMFGELQFITKEPATADVFASDDVTCFVIDGDRLDNELLSTYPHTVKRFYRHLCTVLAKRITKRENYLRQL